MEDTKSRKKTLLIALAGIGVLAIASIAFVRSIGQPSGEKSTAQTATAPQPQSRPVNPTRDFSAVHVFVLLCDNAHQRIAKVPAALGDGKKPSANLYWGAMYGVKTFFARSAGWKPLACSSPLPDGVLDRAVFEGVFDGRKVILVAEAYDGEALKRALEDFFQAAAGKLNRNIEIRSGNSAQTLTAGSGSDLICFVGHNALMDVQLDETPSRGSSGGPADVVVLTCKSRDYFAGPLKKVGCRPLITTCQFMAPEAYTLDAIIRDWATGKSPIQIKSSAAAAYAKYQKCSIQAAAEIFVAGE